MQKLLYCSFPCGKFQIVPLCSGALAQPDGGTGRVSGKLLLPKFCHFFTLVQFYFAVIRENFKATSIEREESMIRSRGSLHIVILKCIFMKLQ